ncbi:TPA: hypothetical protein N0F65_007262 [Lagenidium giganteum]|uniref:Uncharacterized protein n=1 Tax=Lagenidium giganteum TaxID=4803 RepID=A0AAV2YUF6_9STRA|nr:TPA: hypothetical protein N0F65_007262 [Lagenidium giganteum]
MRSTVGSRTCVQELNTKRDKHGFKFARKAMIRCGMSLNADGKWKVSWLYPQLQQIIKEVPDAFAGNDKTEVLCNKIFSLQFFVL